LRSQSDSVRHIGAFLRALVFLLGAAVSASAQITTGTIGVIYYTNDKIIMAADSRGTSSDGTRTDAECKIAALGNDMIFVSTGVGGYDSGDPRSPTRSWRNADEAHRVYERLSAGGSRHPSVAEVASEWSNIIVRNEMFLYERIPQQVLDAATDSVLTEAMFGGTADDGSLLVISTDIVVHPDASPPITAEIGMELPPGSVGVIGKKEIFSEFFQVASDRAKAEAARWEKESARFPTDDREFFRMLRLIDLTITYDQSGEVGGAIDAVELGLGKGIRWRQRKAVCPAE